MDAGLKQTLFQYEPLLNPRRYIRLLEVVDLDEGRDIPVHCRLTAWPIEEAPPYYAISYTWGDPSQRTQVLINGSPLEVRRNCEYVLKQAKWYGGGPCHHVWCDAICIDQTNDDEKGHQVAIMGDIYQGARQVLACVGKHISDSAFLFSKVRSNALFLRCVGCFLKPEEVAPSRFAPSSLVLREWIILRLLVLVWVVRQAMLGHGKRLFKALAALASQQYFERLWVYQELFLGREVILACGQDYVPLRTLYPLVAIAFRYMREMPEWVSVLRAAPMLAAGSRQTLSKQPLVALLASGTWLECLDPRDKIYGLLSMVDWGQNRPIEPDYTSTRDMFDFAVEVVAKVQEVTRKEPGYVQTRAGDNGRFLHNIEPMTLLVVNQPPAQGGLARAVQQRQSDPWPDPVQHVATHQGRRSDLASDLSLPCLGLRLQKKGEKWHLGSDGSTAPDDEPTLLLPDNAEPGDWCLMPRIPPGLPGVVLIARCPAEPGHGAPYEVVGKGCIKAPTDAFLRDGATECWEVHFDPEDLLVLFCSGILWFYYVLVDEKALAEYLRTRVCRHPGSTVATRRGCAYEGWKEGAYLQEVRFGLPGQRY